MIVGDACIRPRGLCCRQGCDHPPECDHVDHGTYATSWEAVWSGPVVVRWLPGGEWCNRCGWWLRESEPPQEVIEWREANPSASLLADMAAVAQRSRESFYDGSLAAEQPQLVSFCASHTPAALADMLGTAHDGVLHMSADQLAQVRAESAVHIGECSQGPIVSVPVSTDESDLCTCGHVRDVHSVNGCEMASDDGQGDCVCTWFQSVREI